MERRSLVTGQSIYRTSFNQVESLNRDALSLCNEGRYEEAIALFTQVIELEPNHAAAWYGRGDALANIKKYRDALTNFNRAIELNPENHAAWTFRAVVLIYLQRFQDALESCDRALKIQPNDREAWAFRGAALNHLNRYQESYRSYDRATGRQRASFWQQLVELLKSWLQRLRALVQVEVFRRDH